MSLDPGTAQPAPIPPSAPTPPAVPTSPQPASPQKPLTKVDPWKEYELFVGDTQRATERRQSVNTIYLSVNSLLLGAVALLAQAGGLDKPLFLPIVILIAIAGFVICGDWSRIINSYRTYINVRFDVLKGMENGFEDSVKMYHVEDQRLKYNDPHHGFYRIEINLPAMFRILYVVGALILLVATVIGQWGAIAPFLHNTFNLPV